MTEPITITVPAGEPTPAPPAGTAWRFLRAYLDPGTGRPTSALMIAINTTPTGPTPPPGCTWRLTRWGGQHVYVAVPQPWLRDLDR